MVAVVSAQLQRCPTEGPVRGLNGIRLPRDRKYVTRAAYDRRWELGGRGSREKAGFPELDIVQ